MSGKRRLTASRRWERWGAPPLLAFSSGKWEQPHTSFYDVSQQFRFDLERKYANFLGKMRSKRGRPPNS